MHSLEEIGATVPAFLVKLWKMVEDEKTNDLIAWNSTGTSFCIRNHAQFAQELLPHYYKHNNMASFIRQLNMYGFRKVVSPDGGCLKPDKDEVEFAHPGFIMGHPYLLAHIKRKIPVAKLSEDGTVPPELMKRVLTDVKGLKGRQENVSSQLTEMKRENEVLWREVAVLRQKHLKQQQIVNKLIQFLVSMVHTSRSGGIGIKRHYPFMLSHMPHGASKSAKLNRTASPSGPVIHELDPESASPEEDVSTIEDYIVPEFVTEPAEVAATSPGHMIEPECDLETAVNASSPEMLLELAEECSMSPEEMFQTPVDPELKTRGKKSKKSTAKRKKQKVKKFEEENAEPVEYSILSDAMLDVVTPSMMHDNAQDGLSSPANDTPVSASPNGKPGSSNADMTLARTDSSDHSRCAMTEDLDLHLDSMDSELDSLKELLKGEGYSLDANTLLSLFNEDPYSYELPFPMETEIEDKAPGSELAPFNSTLDLDDMLEASNDEWLKLPATGAQETVD